LTTQAPTQSLVETGQPPLWEEIARPTGSFLVSVQEDLRKQSEAFHSEIQEYALYALGAQGKQIRPMLFGLSMLAAKSQASQLSPESIDLILKDGIEVASIIEMVHLATLAHDDILDDADIRRGKPTLARKWGNEMAVLLGDCLFACAVERAALLEDPFVFRKLAVATRRVCFGEALQAHQRLGFTMKWGEYLEVISSKTAELFALSCELGGYSGDGSETDRKALADFGMSLGVAYQMFDDCVDLFGSERQAGKSLRTDLEKGKLTLPTLLILNEAEPKVAGSLLKDLKNVDSCGVDSIVQRLLDLGALQRSIEEILSRLKGAEKSLTPLADSVGKERLIEISHYVARQTQDLRV
jgi:octaprenyl-diphosphate synthase